LSVALSINSNIFATVDSSYKLVTFISIKSPVFMLPDNTFSPSFIFTNSDSPVRDFKSSRVLPFVTIPSNGIFSPPFIINISPIFISFTSFTS